MKVWVVWDGGRIQRILRLLWGRFWGKGGKVGRIWFRGGFLRYFELAKEYPKGLPRPIDWRDEGLIQQQLWGLWFRAYLVVCRACDGIPQIGPRPKTGSIWFGEVFFGGVPSLRRDTPKIGLPRPRAWGHGSRGGSFWGVSSLRRNTLK